MAENEGNKIVREAQLKTTLTELRTRVYTRKEVEAMLESEGLSEWQKSYLEKLEDQEVKSKFAVALSVNPSSKETTGEAVSLTLTATVKYDGKPVDATITSKDGLTFTGSGGTYTANATFAVPTNTNGSNSKSYGISASYTKDGTAMSKDANASFNLYSNCVILQTADTDLPTQDAIKAATNKRKAITGTYDIPVVAGQYVWLCVPNGLTAVSKITSSGFGVPFEAAQNVEVTIGEQKVVYRCYRISGAPQSSPMSVVIS